jgi:hypothetical protein
VKDIHDHYKLIATKVRVGGLYKINATRKGHQALESTTMFSKELRNQRYGHLNYKDLLLLHKRGMVEWLPLLKSEHKACEGCALGKQHRE